MREQMYNLKVAVDGGSYQLYEIREIARLTKCRKMHAEELIETKRIVIELMYDAYEQKELGRKHIERFLTLVKMGKA